MHDYVDTLGVRNMILSAQRQETLNGRMNDELEMIWNEALMSGGSWGGGGDTHTQNSS
jgi:hypothetical protein